MWARCDDLLSATSCNLAGPVFTTEPFTASLFETRPKAWTKSALPELQAPQKPALRTPNAQDAFRRNVQWTKSSPSHFGRGKVIGQNIDFVQCFWVGAIPQKWGTPFLHALDKTDRAIFRLRSRPFSVFRFCPMAAVAPPQVRRVDKSTLRKASALAQREAK